MVTQRIGVACLALLLASTAGRGAQARRLRAREEVTPVLGRAMVELARARMRSTLSGKPPPTTTGVPARLQEVVNGAGVLLLKRHQVVGQAFARQSSLAGNVQVAAARAAALVGGENPDKLTLLLTVFLPGQPLRLPPLARNLGRHAALGVHGVEAEFRGLKQFLPPLIPLLRGWNWQEVLFNLAEGLSPAGPPYRGPAGAQHERQAYLLREIILDHGFRLTLVPGVTIASPPDGETEVVYRLGRLLEPGDVTFRTIRAAIARAGTWYQRNQAADGLFPYLYDPLEDSCSKKRHLLREMMNVAAVGLLWRHTRERRVRAMGIKALKRLFSRAYVEDPKTGYGYLRLPGDDKVSLGPAAAGLLAIVRLRADQVDGTFKERSAHLAAFLNGMRRGNGSYALAWPDDGTILGRDYYPGEAQLALMAWALECRNGDRDQADKCLRSMRYYRDYFEHSLAAGPRDVPYPMIPWHTQACFKLYVATRRQEVADFVFRMTRMLLPIQETAARPGEFLAADVRGRFLSPRKRATGKPHVSSTAVYLEGLAEALALARALGEKRLAERIRTSLLWGARQLLQLQIKDEIDALPFSNPERALGGFRTRLDHPTIRVDNMQHAVSALVKIAAVLRRQDYAPPARENSGKGVGMSPPDKAGSVP